jgi:hypothetical protein
MPWSNPVIPLWEVGVKEDAELFFDLRSHFSPCGVDRVEKIDGNFSTGFRARVRHQLLHQLDTGADHALPGAREVRKQPRLNRVVLGGVGGIMRHPDVEAEFLHTLGEVGFTQIRAGAIAATPIAEQEPRIGCRRVRWPRGLPPLAETVTGACTRLMTGPSRDGAMLLPEIVHPVGNDHPLRQPGEGMLQGLDGFLRRACPWPVEIANQCFFWVSMRTTGLPHAVYSSLSRAIFVPWAARCMHSPVRWRFWA